MTNEIPKGQLGLAVVDGVTRFSQEAVKWGFMAVMTWQGRLAIGDLAGKVTIADLTLSGLAPEQKDSLRPLLIGIISGGSGLLVGLAGILYGLSQRRLRLQIVEILGNRNKQLEEAADPKRTSSKLNRKGLAKRRDR